MSAYVVRKQFKEWALAITSPIQFIDTDNIEEDPSGNFMTLNFNAELISKAEVSGCLLSESGMVDLVFMLDSGKGDDILQVVETFVSDLYQSKDNTGAVTITGLQPMEAFNDADHYRVVCGIEYTFKYS